MSGRKRANGEGTIYRRADGRYEGAAVVLIRDGGRRRVRVYAATRKEARTKLDRMLDDARQGIPTSTHKQTVGDYLDYWLAHVVRPELRPSSYSGYEIMVRRHIKPVLGGRYLADLSPADVRRLLATLREKETTGHGGGPRTLSPRMVQFAHAVLRNALSNAVREELVGRNVAKMVRTSNPEYEVTGGLDPVAARALLAKITDDRLYALYLCAIVLGMRRGRAAGPDLGRGRPRHGPAVGAPDAGLGCRAAARAAAQDPRVPPADPAARRRGHRAARAPGTPGGGADRRGRRLDRQRVRLRHPAQGSDVAVLADQVLARGPEAGRRPNAAVPRPPTHRRVAAAGARRAAARGPGNRRPQRHQGQMMVYAHGRLDEKAAALTRLGTAVTGTLPSTVAVNPAEPDQAGH